MKIKTAHRDRRRPLAGILAAALAAFVVIGPAGAAGEGQEPADAQKVSQGHGLYLAWCGSCHGETAGGDGPMAEFLTIPPTDLTLLSQEPGRRLDFDAVTAKVDGRETVRGHGSKEMPVWGEAFKVAEEYGGEAMARAKIRAIVHYLQSIQAGESAGDED